MPAVDRQGQCPAHARVVERFALVIGGDAAGDIPIALLHRNLVAERLDELVPRCGRQAAKLDRGAVAADRLDPYRLFVGVNTGEAVEIGPPFMVVVAEFFALYGLADLMIDKLEGAGTDNVLLVPARIPIEDILLVDEVERVGESRQKRAGREFEVEDDGLRVGGLDFVHHQIITGPCAQLAIRRKNDLVVAGGNVGSGEWRAVVEFDVPTDLERVGSAIVSRLRHLRAEIADEMRDVRRVLRVDPDQHAVERCDRMHRCIGALAMTVETWRRIRGDHVGEAVAIFRLLIGQSRRKRRHAEQHAERPQHRHSRESGNPEPRGRRAGPPVPARGRPWTPASAAVTMPAYLSNHTVAKSWFR